MTFYDFMAGSPWLTFFLAWFGCHLIFRVWNRLMRVITMLKNGYPPEHCDADGDFKPEPETQSR